jgi:hypothetical protein
METEFVKMVGKTKRHPRTSAVDCAQPAAAVPQASLLVPASSRCPFNFSTRASGRTVTRSKSPLP